MRTTPRRALSILAVALALAAPARGGEDLEANLEAKLAKPFLGYAPWARDLDEALGRAKKEHKLVFAYFARSYIP